MTFEIEWRPRARNDFDGLDRTVRQRVQSAIERLASNDGDVRKLVGIDPPVFRVRVGDWRVLFGYAGHTIVIRRILPRDKAYR
jgi:mRNA interferase RelE/StbE